MRGHLPLVSLLMTVGLLAAGCERRFTNRGEGMAPAIKDGEQVVATRRDGAPLRADGDRIESRSGQIFINGQPLSESYVPEDYRSHDTVASGLITGRVNRP